MPLVIFQLLVIYFKGPPPDFYNIVGVVFRLFVTLGQVRLSFIGDWVAKLC